MFSELVRDDEEDMIRGLEAGDLKALRKLYDRYAAPVYGLILLRAPDETAANDLLVDVFSEILKNIREYRQYRGLSLFSWVMKSAREVAMRAYPEAHIAGNELSTLAKSGILQFINTLPEQDRKVFVLSYVNGLSRHEVAERVNKPEEDVLRVIQESMTAFRKYTGTV